MRAPARSTDSLASLAIAVRDEPGSRKDDSIPAARDATRGPRCPRAAGRHLLRTRRALRRAPVPDCAAGAAQRHKHGAFGSEAVLRPACGGPAQPSSWTSARDTSPGRRALFVSSALVADPGSLARAAERRSAAGGPERSLGAAGSVRVPLRGASRAIRHRRATQCAPRPEEVPARKCRRARPSGCVPRGRDRLVLAEPGHRAQRLRAEGARVRRPRRSPSPPAQLVDRRSLHRGIDLGPPPPAPHRRFAPPGARAGSPDRRPSRIMVGCGSCSRHPPCSSSRSSFPSEPAPTRRLPPSPR